MFPIRTMHSNIYLVNTLEKLNIFAFKDNYIVEYFGQATWSRAINACLRNNGSLSKNEVDFRYNWEYWLPYFRYEEGKLWIIHFVPYAIQHQNLRHIDSGPIS